MELIGQQKESPAQFTIYNFRKRIPYMSEPISISGNSKQRRLIRRKLKQAGINFCYLFKG
jgi:hypothetical protein